MAGTTISELGKMFNKAHSLCRGQKAIPGSPLEK